MKVIFINLTSCRIGVGEDLLSWALWTTRGAKAKSKQGWFSGVVLRLPGQASLVTYLQEKQVEAAKSAATEKAQAFRKWDLGRGTFEATEST